MKSPYKPLLSERLLTKYLSRDIGRSLDLEEANDLRLPDPKPGQKYMLYLHVPFCEELCPYCSFNRFLFKHERAARYYKQLRQEMRMVAAMGYQFDSLYLGGGTPTVIVDEVVETIELANELFDIKDVSCETNPDHLQPAMLEKLKGKVQRLSVGMQSFDDGLLKQMHRYDKYGSGELNLRRFQEIAGIFPTLNIDMIFNFPSQTEAMIRKDIDYILASGANQTTFYPLMTAPSVERSLEKTLGAVSYPREKMFFDLLDRELAPHLPSVSAWCFARQNEGMVDEYIVDHEEYVGIGSGSFSYLDGGLYVNTFSLRDYAARIETGRLPTLKYRHFNRHERMRYRFLMDLFGLELDKGHFRDSFGVGIYRGLPLEMAFMTVAGAFDRNGREKLTLTRTGRYLMVVMMREFFSSMDKVREQARFAMAPEEAQALMGEYYENMLRMKGSE